MTAVEQADETADPPLDEPVDPPPDDGLPTWLGAFSAGGRGWYVVAAVAAAVALLLGGIAIGRNSAEPSADAVDVGFLIDMSTHHDQAVQMAMLELANGTDGEVISFAREVVIFQRFELGKMAAYLEARGMVRPDDTPDRPVMAWMGMGGTVEDMPGMASAADMQRLTDARGNQADLLFLRLMTAHHEGGLHMADHAAQHAEDPLVSSLAANMAKVQRSEIAEYARSIDRLAKVTPGG